MRNNSGKALTIFLVLIAVILVSLTAISVFLLIKQVQLRESAEYNLAQLKTSESVLRAELDKANKEKEILDKKSKEAESKIEGLLEELDLAQGVRDEVKKENRELKDSLDALKKKNKEANEKLASQETEADKKMSDLQDQLNAALERNKTLEAKRQELEQEYETLKAQLSPPASAPAATATTSEATQGGDSKQADNEVNVDLKKIVVSAGEKSQGQVVSVDHDADFVIVNMGGRQGVAVDSVLSVYDKDKYLGDVVITKVLPEMSAADFISPLTSQQVSEGDLVKLKQ